MPYEVLVDAVRAVRRRPLFAASVVATLGACLGAVAATIAVLAATLYRPLPFPEPEALQQVGIESTRGGEIRFRGAIDGSEWLQLRDAAVGVPMAAYSGTETRLNMVVDGGAAWVTQRRIGTGYFAVFGLPLALGREFTPEEDRAGGEPVVILGHGLWKRAFGARRDLIGSTVSIAGGSYRVVGVAPAAWPDPVDAWTPLRAGIEGEGSGRNFQVVSRVPSELSAAATTQWVSASRGLAPIDTPAGPWVRRYEGRSLKAVVDEPLRTPLGVIQGLVALLLLLGCANAAGMLLARGTERDLEFATRTAIGATRRQLVAAAVAESLILAWSAAAVGMLAGASMLAVLRRILPTGLGDLAAATIDAGVAFGTLLVATAVGLLASLPLAVRVYRGRSPLASAVRGGAASHGSRLGLTTVQLCISMAALVAAGLLMRGYDRLAGLDPGFDGDGVLAASIGMRDERLQEPARATAYLDAVVQRLATIPGVAHAAVVLSTPYDVAVNDAIAVPGAEGEAQVANLNYASPDYFAVFRVPLLRGRMFNGADQADSEPVAIVNAAFERQWGGDDGIVETSIEVAGVRRRIVGVVGDTLEQSNWGDFGLVGRPPAVVIPAAQAGDRMALYHTWFSPSFVVRGTGDVEALRRAVADAVEGVDPTLPVAEFRTPGDAKSLALAVPRFMATLLSSLAAFALLIAALGVHGVVRQAIAVRWREFGIRTALGSSSLRLVWTALRPVVIALAAGGLAGTAIALAGARAVSSMLHGVPGHDATTLIAAGTLLCVVVIGSTLPVLNRLRRLAPSECLRTT